MLSKGLLHPSAECNVVVSHRNLVTSFSLPAVEGLSQARPPITGPSSHSVLCTFCAVEGRCVCLKFA